MFAGDGPSRGAVVLAIDVILRVLHYDVHLYDFSNRSFSGQTGAVIEPSTGGNPQRRMK